MSLLFDRWYTPSLKEKLERPFVHLIFGARQTGKSTLLNTLLPPEALRIDLADPQERARYLAQPGEFIQVCRALPAEKRGQFVFVDEVQTVPALFDAVQHLYDSDKERWRFVLCGSSPPQFLSLSARTSVCGPDGPDSPPVCALETIEVGL